MIILLANDGDNGDEAQLCSEKLILFLSEQSLVQVPKRQIGRVDVFFPVIFIGITG
jgi:hypothetical protein